MFRKEDQNKLKKYLSFRKEKQDAAPRAIPAKRKQMTSERVADKDVDNSKRKETKKSKKQNKERSLIEDVQTLLANDVNDDYVDHHHDQAGDDLSTVSNTRSQQLAAKARQKLSNSLFRSLNEYLYSHSSYEARKNFSEEKFKLYHKAYANILENWPVKPINYLIDILKKQIKPKDLAHTVLADIGCGSRPHIALAFPTATVYSFDLYSRLAEDVDPTKYQIMSADMSTLPLESGTCHYVIYSLSLMPINLTDCFYEANRILQVGGQMLIVEVASRFAEYQSTVKRIVHQEKHLGQLFSHDLRCFGFQLTKHELLKPDDFFVYFCFKKTENLEGVKKKSTLPSISLKACVYKSR